MDFAKAVINIVKRDGNHKEIMGVWEPPLNNFFFWVFEGEFSFSFNAMDPTMRTIPCRAYMALV